MKLVDHRMPATEATTHSKKVIVKQKRKARERQVSSSVLVRHKKRPLFTHWLARTTGYACSMAVAAACANVDIANYEGPGSGTMDERNEKEEWGMRER